MGLEPERRERMLKAAMHAFREGYKNASTDQIVKDAGISKGLLFHYFGTKEGLYGFLLWYAFDVMVQEYANLINFEQRDIIERLRQMILLKWDLGLRYPDLSDFMLAAYTRERDDPSDQFSAMFQAMQTSIGTKLMANIDVSLFREDIDAGMAVNSIQWSLFGYSNSKVTADKNFKDYREEYQNYLNELDQYFAMFRKVFYKQHKEESP
jgi:AcrR family transcriptional regulator